MHDTLEWVRLRWRLLFILLVPLVLLPLPIIENSTQGRCAYIVLILSFYWIFEVIPLPVTSLLALILFPMAGVVKAKDIAPEYFKDIVALFIGSLSFACAIESVNLHRRIALFVLSTVGTSSKRSMAGLMGVTAFLSMWINNSAAASIMLPVALAISKELEQHAKDNHRKKHGIVNDALTLNEIEFRPFRQFERSVEVRTGCLVCCNRTHGLTADEILEKRYNELQKGFLLAVAYSATIGGLSTLVGTGTNVLAKGFAESEYQHTDFRINFLNFLLFALPVAICMIILCWFWLQFLFNRHELFQCRTDADIREVEKDLKAMLTQQYQNLGKPTWNEYSVGIVFILMILLWITKEFPDTPGWDIIFQKGFIEDSTVAVLCGLLPLILPNANPFQKNWKYQPIIRWEYLAKNLPWGAVILLGSGLAVAKAFQTSGLSESVANALRFLKEVPRLWVIFLIIVISGLFTEVTSNVSTVTIFLPVLDSVATSTGIHPGFLILPCTLAVSLAFMLPIATPPNAIIFSSGTIKVVDMIKAGVVMNIVGILLIFLAATTWMPKIYSLDDQTTAIFFNISRTTTTRTSTIKNILK